MKFGVSFVEPVFDAFGLPFPLSKEQVYTMQYDSRIDNSKARAELGMDVTPLETGLETTLAWYRDNGFLSVSPIDRSEPRSPITDT